MPDRNEPVVPRASIYTEDWTDELVCRTLGLVAWQLLRAGWRVQLAGIRPPDPMAIGAICGRDLRWCSTASVGRFAAFLSNLAASVSPRAARFLSGRLSLSFARGTDLLICWSERIPPYCPALRGWLIVPRVDRGEAEIQTDVEGCGLRVSDREKQRRLESWQRVFTPLECIADEVRRRWKVEPEELLLPLLLPAGSPSADAFVGGEIRALCGDRGERRIRCLARMAKLFRDACKEGLSGWRFRDLQEDASADAGHSGRGDGVPNSGRIVWFRCSGGQDCDGCDSRWTTCVSSLASAMASGVVPVVDAGATVRELVRRSGCGFVCKSDAEIVSRTLALAGSPDLLASYSRLACEAADNLSEARFEERIASLIAAPDRRQAA
ncbi:MAG: hypothetical protein KatS3mg024_0587 [Armatimonadota bacterium]|nr:MAG: hypothetical protein KatS3mg024_0587 [Armatimonadota bacterium]